MKKLVLTFIGFLMICLTAGIAQAALVVDTGEGSEYTWGLGIDQWWAAEFELLADYTISDIETYIMPGTRGITQLTAVIYSDGGDLPGTEIFSQTFTVPESRSFAWLGVNGISLDLTAGTYWVAFEVRTGDTFSGAINTDTPTPLINEAWNYGSGYSDADSYDIAVRINETTTAVPIPSTLGLFSFGILGLVCIRRKPA